MLAFILLESQNSNAPDCVHRPPEGEWELVVFRLKGKFLLLEEEVAATLKPHGKRSSHRSHKFF